jgi:hypothetical protein
VLYVNIPTTVKTWGSELLQFLAAAVDGVGTDVLEVRQVDADGDNYITFETDPINPVKAWKRLLHEANSNPTHHLEIIFSLGALIQFPAKAFFKDDGRGDLKRLAANGSEQSFLGR